MTVTLLLAGLLLLAWLAAQVAPRLVAHPNSPSEAGPIPSRARAGKSAASALREPPAQAPVVATLGAVLIGGSLGLFALFEDVVMKNPMVGVDQQIHASLRGLRATAGDWIMIVITELGDQQVFVPVAVAALAACALMKRWHAAIYMGVAIAGAAAFVGGAKMVLKRPRPMAIYDGIVEYSFPSGHAAMTMVLLGFVGLLLMQGTAPSRRRYAAFACITAILWICVSRVYLGAHWFSDVAVGLLFGLAWVALVGTLYLRHETAPLPARTLAAVVLAAYVLGGGWHIARSFSKDTSKYAASASAPRPAAVKR
jgi:membrane-associated phospholipid phosphatase